MKLRLPLSLAAAIVAACTTISTTYAAGDSISINFAGNNVSGSEIAGIEAVIADNWNNLANSTSGSSSNLKNNNGSSTSASVSWLATAVWGLGGSPTTQTQRMLSRHLITDLNPAGSLSITLTDLPYLVSDIYIYTSGQKSATYQNSPIIVNGVSYQGDGSSSTIQGTDAWGTLLTNLETPLQEGVNYLKITNISGTNITLTNGMDGVENLVTTGIAGIQIVDAYTGYLYRSLTDGQTIQWNDPNIWATTKGGAYNTTWAGAGSAAYVDVTGSATLNITGATTADGLVLEGGTLTLTGDTLTLVGPTTLKANNGSSLNIENQINYSDTLALGGSGQISLKTLSAGNVSAGTSTALVVNNTSGAVKLTGGTSLTTVASGTSYTGDTSITLSPGSSISNYSGAAGNTTGNVSLQIGSSGDTTASTVTGATYVGSSNGATIGGDVKLIAYSTIFSGIANNMSICGGIGDGLTTGKTTIELYNCTVAGHIAGGYDASGLHVAGGVDIIIMDSTVTGNVGLNVSKSKTSPSIIHGNSSITIGGDSVVGSVTGVGGGKEGYGKLVGNLITTIEGNAIIGLGKEADTAGDNTGAFNGAGRDLQLDGNLTINIKGGQILNNQFLVAGTGNSGTNDTGAPASITGNAIVNISGGEIQSFISGAGAYYNNIAGNITFNISGGKIGKEGSARFLTGGTRLGTNNNMESIKGNVTINLTGGTTGKGATILDNYDIYAGSVTSSTTVKGNTLVNLANVTVSGGISEYAGVISGANSTGSGVNSASSRTLTFDNYNTYTNAQYKYFTLAKALGSSFVELLGDATSIDKWEITDNSTVKFSKASVLGGAPEILVDATGTLQYSGTDAQTLSAVIDGAGTLLMDATGSLTLTGANTLSGNVNLKNGTLTINSDTALGTASIMVTGKGTGSGAKLVTTAGGNTINIASFSIAEGGSIDLSGAASTQQTLNIASSSTWAGGATGSTLTMDYDDKVNITGGLAITGAMDMAMDLSTLTFGQQYTLVTTTTGVTGISNFSLLQLTMSSYRAGLTLSADGKDIILEVLSNSPADLTWADSVTGGVWKIGVGDWDTTETNKKFYSGDNVTFDDSPSSSYTVTVSGNVAPGNMTLNNATAYIFNGGGNTISVNGAFTKNLAGDAAFNNGTLLLNGTLALNAGSITLNSNALITFGDTVTFANSGTTFNFNGGTIDLSNLAATDITLGSIGTIGTNSGVLNISDKVVTASSSTTTATGINILGTGRLLVSGSNALYIAGSDVTADLYSGTGGLTFTGKTSNRVYSGSWLDQTAAGGTITIGSTTSSVSTFLTIGYAGVVANLGTVNSDPAGVDSTIVSDLTIQGSAVAADFINGTGTANLNTAFNTVLGASGSSGIKARIAASTGAINVYGSVRTTLSGIAYYGTGANSVGTNSNLLIAGGDTGSTIYGNVSLTISNSYIDSKVWGTGGSVNGSITYNFSDSYFNNVIYLGTGESTDYVTGDISLTATNTVFKSAIYGRQGANTYTQGALSISLTDSHAYQIALGAQNNSTTSSGATLTLTNTTVTADIRLQTGSHTFTGDATYYVQGTSVINRLFATGADTASAVGDYVVHMKDTAKASEIIGGAGGTVTGSLTYHIYGNAEITTALRGGTSGSAINGAVKINVYDNAKITALIGARSSNITISGGITVSVYGDAEVTSLYTAIDSGRSVTSDLSVTVGGNAEVTTLYNGIYGNGNLTGTVSATIEGNAIIGKLYGVSINSGTYTGDATITIKDNATVGTFWGLGYQEGPGNKSIMDGNMVINMSGGTVGNNLTSGTGSTANDYQSIFSFSGANGIILGNAELNISGGTIISNYISPAAGGEGRSGVGGVSGDFTIRLSGTGTIESNIRMGGRWQDTGVQSNVNILLNGGTIGKSGEARSIDMSRVDNTNSSGSPVKGNVNITIDGTGTTNGQGTTFVGTSYDIFAGSSNPVGSGVDGNSTVTIKNITSQNSDGTSGFANNANIIAGAGSNGGGIAGTKTLVFSAYGSSSGTVTKAQYKYFDIAQVKDASWVILQGESSTGITKWELSGASTLEFAKTVVLGGATSFAVDTGSSLYFNGTTAQTLDATVSGAGNIVIGNGTAASSLTLTGTLTSHTGNLEIRANSTGTLVQSATATLGQKLTGAGSFILNNTASGIVTTLNNTASDFTGAITVTQGTLVLADGVKFASSTATVTDTLKLNSADLNNTISTISGSGMVVVGSTAATWSNAALNSFAGTLKLDNSAALTYTISDTNSLNAGLTLNLAENSKLTLVNNSSTAVSYTGVDLVLSGTGSQIHLEGSEGIELSFTNNDWMLDYSTGSVTFYRGLETSDFKVKAGSDALGVYTNVFLVEEGITYQTKTDASGYLVKLTVEDMTELPAVGVVKADGDIVAYRITGRESDSSGTLTMVQDDVKIASLTISANAGNTNSETHSPNYKWDLNGRTVEIMNGSLFFQVDSTSDPVAMGDEYLITDSSGTPGTITGSASSGKLSITQTSTAYALHIAVDIIDNDTPGALDTVILKQGGGKLILSGNLTNTGGVEVSEGTLQLQGNATGASGNDLSILGGKLVLLGESGTPYTLGFDSLTLATGTEAAVDAYASLGDVTVTNAGTIIYNPNSIVTNVGNIENNGTVDFKLGTGNSATVSDAMTGTGAIKITTGTVTFTDIQSTTQSVDIASGAYAVFETDASSSYLDVISGSGTFTIKNTSGAYLNLQDKVTGADWTKFDGTLILDGNGYTLRVQSRKTIIGSAASGEATIIVNDKAQYWDVVNTGATITNHWEISGTGPDGFGAMRLRGGSIYTGNIKVDDNGAGIAAAGGTISLNGIISGGIVSLGYTSTSSNNWKDTFTLNGINTHAGTAVYKAKVIAQNANSLGSGLSLMLSDSEVELKASVSLDYLNSTQATSKVDLGSGNTLTLKGTTTSDYVGSLTGTGTLALTGSGIVTLSGASDFTGAIALGTDTHLIASSTTALGNTANVVTMAKGSTLDLTDKSISNNVTITTSANLTRFSAYTGELTINGAAGEQTVVTGNLSANKLHLGANSNATVSGDITIADGGSLFLNAANANSTTPMLAVSGAASMGGIFDVAFDTSDVYSGDTLVYNVVKSSSGTVTDLGSLDFTIDMDAAYKKFFTLDGDYKQDFLDTGDLTITINREIVRGMLINQSEDADISGSDPLDYLGAKNDETEVRFTSTYTPASTDTAYRLTNGDGWLIFDPATQILEDKPGSAMELIINNYVESTSTIDRGITMTARDNTFTGGTAIFDVHVKSEADGASGTEIKTFGTGEITVLGQQSDFELTTATGSESNEYTYSNDFRLADGATITQTAGNNTLSGDIVIGVGAAATIQNASETETLTLAGGLSGTNLVMKGAATGGYISLSGQQADADRTLGSLTLEDNTKLTLNNNANLTVDALSFTSGSDIYVNTDTDFSITGSTATGEGRIYMNGGTLHLHKSLTLNSAGLAQIVFLGAPYNPITRASSTIGSTIDVKSGATVTINTPTADASAAVTKTGGGTLILTQDLSYFKGTAGVEEGLLQITFANGNFTFGGSLIAGGGTTTGTLDIEGGAVVRGSLTIAQNGKLILGDNVTVEGALNIADGIEFIADKKATFKGDVTLGTDSYLQLAEGTLLGYDGATFTLNEGSHLHFGTGKGSQFTGALAAPLTFVRGSGYEGFLDAGANDISFEAGSIYYVNGSLKYKDAGSFTGALQSSGTIAINKATVFELGEFTADKLERYTDGFCLISTSGKGSITVGSNALVQDEDYSYLLTNHSYDWLQFSLLGGTSGKTLDLYISVQADYYRLGQTANEIAIAPIANELANNFAGYDGELRYLGANLALSSGNGAQLLSNLALSTSSVMTAYQVQTAGLRRHAFDILNRASQEVTGSERLGYEQYANTVWVNAVGGTYKLDSDANALGNTTNVWGGTFGYSRAVGENLSAGLAFTYTNSDSNMNDGFGTANVDAYYIDAFARYNKSNWNIIAILTGGFTSSEVERNMTIGDFHSRTKGSADGDQFYALLQAGYQFELSDDGDSILEPYAVITGGYSSIDGFTESGAGNAGLQVDGQSQALCSAGAGVRFVQNFLVGTDTLSKGRFEARALFLQDITDTDITVDANFIGMPGQRFSQEGMSAGKSAFIFGTGVVLPVGMTTELFADIDAEFRSSETGVRANLGVRLSF